MLGKRTIHPSMVGYVSSGNHNSSVHIWVWLRFGVCTELLKFRVCLSHDTIDTKCCWSTQQVKCDTGVAFDSWCQRRRYRKVISLASDIWMQLKLLWYGGATACNWSCHDMEAQLHATEVAMIWRRNCMQLKLPWYGGATACSLISVSDWKSLLKWVIHILYHVFVLFIFM